MEQVENQKIRVNSSGEHFIQEALDMRDVKQMRYKVPLRIV